MEAAENWYRVSTKALVIKDGKLLLVKEGSDFWDLPGGGLDHQDEEPKSGLARELVEKLGASLAHCSELPIFVWKTYDSVNKRPIIVLGYKVRLETEDFKLQAPVSAIQYINLEEISAEKMEPYTRPFYGELVALMKSLL